MEFQPQNALATFFRREAALRPAKPDPRYAYLPADERARIVTLLRETHTGLPENWLMN